MYPSVYGIHNSKSATYELIQKAYKNGYQDKAVLELWLGYDDHFHHHLVSLSQRLLETVKLVYSFCPKSDYNTTVKVRFVKTKSAV